MSKKILIPIANGTEEIEAVTAIDLFRRAGFDVTVAGTDNEVKCSRSVRIVADELIENIDQKFDIIYLPGGGLGTQNLSKNEILGNILKSHAESNKIIAAICAAPMILKEFGIINNNTKLTSHPSTKDSFGKEQYSENLIERAGNIITSRGAGTAMEFSLYLIELLENKETSDKIAESIVYKRI